MSQLSFESVPEKWKGPDAGPSFNVPPHEIPIEASCSPFLKFLVAPVTPMLMLSPAFPKVTPPLTAEIAFFTLSMSALSNSAGDAPGAGGDNGLTIGSESNNPTALKVAHCTTILRISSSEIGGML